MRHGESEWNRHNLFTGWVDIPLSEKGVQESIEGGKKIAHLPIDAIFTSTLIRGQMTAMLAMLHHSSGKVPCVQHPGEKWSQIYSDKVKTVPVYYASQLNERMYGKLQGMNKQEMREKFGDEQVHRWRRSFDEAPPEGESLKDTADRAIPYFKEKILPLLKDGKSVFIAAHGNSLRAVVMFLDGLSGEEVVGLEMATGAPLVYAFSGEKWHRE